MFINLIRQNIVMDSFYVFHFSDHLYQIMNIHSHIKDGEVYMKNYGFNLKGFKCKNMWNWIKECKYSCNPWPLSDKTISWYDSVAMVFCVSAWSKCCTVKIYRLSPFKLSIEKTNQMHYYKLHDPVICGLWPLVVTILFMK